MSRLTITVIHQADDRFIAAMNVLAEAVAQGKIGVSIPPALLAPAPTPEENVQKRRGRPAKMADGELPKLPEKEPEAPLPAGATTVADPEKIRAECRDAIQKLMGIDMENKDDKGTYRGKVKETLLGLTNDTVDKLSKLPDEHLENALALFTKLLEQAQK